MQSDSKADMQSDSRALIRNTTQDLTEDNESEEQLVAAGTLMGAGEQYGGPNLLASGLLACPDDSLWSLPYQSFFEEECHIIASLLLGDTTAASPSPGQVEGSSLRLDLARLTTSTPLHASPPLHEWAPDSARPAAHSVMDAAQRSTAQRPGGARLTMSQARASPALQFPKVGKRLSDLGTRISQSRGTKLTLAAKSSLQHPSGASQLAQPSAAPKPAPRDTGLKTAGKVVSRRQPSQKFSSRIPLLASRSRLPSLGKVPSHKRICSGSRLIPGKGQERAACARAQRKDSETQTGNGRWESVEPSFSSELVPGLTPGHGDAVAAEQSAGDELSKELERVKGELAKKTAECEAYRQTISSLQAQLRAAGAAAEESGDLGSD
ncbi:hypothetical protein AV530_003754 [Patagioenas fasciata monilis]|uniref:Uncharacterized protein n=1 Tax=Patagioenas fasciata monilis TaxID=372326 RepID=A0A1V4KYL5_PATFA|nr:hypothetical protein AV530_003754 [Patagioenas fasciata monilis]